MKLWTIAVFIFLFNGSLAVVQEMNTTYGLGLQSYVGDIQSDNFITNTTLNQSEQDITKIMEQGDQGILGDANLLIKSVEFFVKGIILFGKTIIGTAVFTEETINNITCGLMPSTFVMLLGMGIRLIFIGAIVQLLIGRSLKESE